MILAESAMIFKGDGGAVYTIVVVTYQSQSDGASCGRYLRPFSGVNGACCFCFVCPPQEQNYRRNKHALCVASACISLKYKCMSTFRRLSLFALRHQHPAEHLHYSARHYTLSLKGILLLS